MKKFTAFVAAVVCAAAAFTFAGCDNPFQKSSAPSEYEQMLSSPSTLPVTHEWQLYEEACAMGYGGTFTEFLTEIGIHQSDDTAAINLALTSVVCIECTFGTGTRATGSLGSGVIYSLDKSAGDAYIITNYHVIYDKDKTGAYSFADNIDVYLYGGYVSARRISATFLRGEINYDIAVLKVSGSKVLKDSSARAATIGDSTAIKEGERVYALGNANGEGFSVTGGVVSVPLETITDNLRADQQTITLPEIRIDAAINHGNSGGGLFNSKGELVGIVNARSENITGVGYAIPTATVIPVVGRVIN